MARAMALHPLYSLALRAEFVCDTPLWPNRVCVSPAASCGPGPKKNFASAKRGRTTRSLPADHCGGIIRANIGNDKELVGEFSVSHPVAENISDSPSWSGSNIPAELRGIALRTDIPARWGRSTSPGDFVQANHHLQWAALRPPLWLQPLLIGA